MDEDQTLKIVRQHRELVRLANLFSQPVNCFCGAGHVCTRCETREYLEKENLLTGQEGESQ